MVTPRRWRLDNDRGSVMTVETPPSAAATAVFSTEEVARWYSKPVKIRFIYFRTIFFFLRRSIVRSIISLAIVVAADRKTNEKKIHTQNNDYRTNYNKYTSSSCTIPIYNAPSSVVIVVCSQLCIGNNFVLPYYTWHKSRSTPPHHLHSHHRRPADDDEQSRGEHTTRAANAEQFARTCRTGWSPMSPSSCDVVLVQYNNNKFNNSYVCLRVGEYHNIRVKL